MTRKILPCFALALLAFTAPAGAQGLVPVPTPTAASATPAPAFNAEAREPDVSGVPLFAQIKNSGGKLHFMGERSGLYGWLIVKDGQIQMVYMTPDRKSVLFGALFTDGGDLVTSHQINKLSEKNKEVAAIMAGTARQELDLTRAGVTEGGVASVPADPRVTNKNLTPPTAIPAIPASPGERLMMDMQASSSVVVGGGETAPELVMVVSPDCSYCKKTWAEMRDIVKAGKVRLRLVPISRDSSTDETRKAAALLRAPNPLEAWDGYASGRAEALGAPADEMALRAIIANREMTDRWNILGTPYLVYRSKDGKIKIVQGKPERMAAVFADLIQQ